MVDTQVKSDVRELLQAGLRVWVPLASPTTQLGGVPLETLEKLFPRIAMFGPNGDNMFAALETTADVLGRRSVSEGEKSVMNEAISVAFAWTNRGTRWFNRPDEERYLFNWAMDDVISVMWDVIRGNEYTRNWGHTTQKNVLNFIYPEWLAGIILEGFSQESYLEQHHAERHQMVTDFLGVDSSLFRYTGSYPLLK